MVGSASVQLVIAGSDLLSRFTEMYNRTITLSNPIGDIQLVSLSTTPLVIAVPSGTAFVLIDPPDGNANLMLFGPSGVATGSLLVLHNLFMSLLAIASSVTSIQLVAAGGTVSGVTVAFY